MATGPWSNIVPLGALEITSAGTTVLLSKNCGSQAGQVGGTQESPNLPGYAFRQIMLTNSSVTAGDIVYVLPRGAVASSDSDQIIAAIMPGQTIYLPQGISGGAGYLPENFCLDIAAGTDVVVYGCGLLG